MIIVCSSTKLLTFLNKFVINKEDKHFKTECSAIENTSIKLQGLLLNIVDSLKRCSTEFHLSFN